MPRYKELFKGAARDYAKYRPGYPKEFFDQVIQRFNLDGKGRLLDLGCGTGQIAIPLAPHFEEVVGLDVDADMLAVGKEEAEKAGVKNIKWLKKRAEDISSDMGTFRLATMAASFHWMEQDKTLVKVYELLEPNGGLVIVSGSSSVWRNTEKAGWKGKVKEIIQKYLGKERRAGSSLYIEPKEKFETVVARSPFGKSETLTYRYERKWNIDAIIGLLYTTSFASKRFFGEKAKDFEKELKEELLKLNPTGEFIEIKNLEVLVARK
ncbi:MAG: class I SAM-dependent methyltransferase [Candidatus Harrisonbacteria bacterium]|nr:class I SAM-dependent methyltransferase [Candidatus Harrisonbacteria bacterium]